MVNDYEGHLARIVKHFSMSDADWIIRVSEEAGEAAETYSRWKGTNPRKGVSAHRSEVAMELADVAATAMAAIVALGFSPLYLLADQRAKSEGRL